MKKFGTPIGAAPGMREREGRVVERRRAVDRAPGNLVAAFFLAWRSSSEMSFLLFRLPALNFWLPRSLRARSAAWPEPPWVRFGAPGLLVAVRASAWRCGFGFVPGTVGTAGTVGTGSGVPVGVGVAIGPLSMICAIAPVMPGIDDLRGGVPGGDVDGLGDALARHEDDRDGVQLGRGRERSDAEANRGHDHRDDHLPSFHFEYASPRALLRIFTSVSTPRVRLFHEAPGRRSRY